MEKELDVWVMDFTEVKIPIGHDVSSSDMVWRIMNELEETLRDVINTLDGERKNRRIDISISLKRHGDSEIDTVSAAINTVLRTVHEK